MTTPAWQQTENTTVALARNVGSRYVMIVINVAIGLVMLPFNVTHLGSTAYGLWMLAGSITQYFGALDLGYGGAIVKFVAEHRARRDARALNEVLSTMFVVFTGIGVLCYAIALVVAALMPHMFNIDVGQVHTGRVVLLIIAVQLALFFPFSVFGGVINGFEKYYINNVVGTVFNVITSAANVVVLLLGYGLIPLVVVTTTLRIVPFLVYRRNAYAVFPELRLRRAYFRRDRLRDLTGFSAYMAVIDWASRLTYTTDAFYVGAFMNITAVAVYAVAQRLSDTLLRVTNQLHTFLFPVVVHRAVDGGVEGQQSLMIKATRFQLAVAVCMCGGIAAVADVLIRAWVGAGFDGAIVATRVLAFVVVLRAWNAMPSTVLKGTGHHQFVAGISCGAAVANLLLSIPLVKMWGLPGVALGTAIPVLATCAFGIFPRACRVVGLGLWRGYRLIVWPTVWPAALVMTLLVMTRREVPDHLLAVLAQLACGGLLYAGIFFSFGLGRDERRWFRSALTQVLRRRSERLAAA
jgi:O-antigen/teichoic acid export membrane protein